ncbi:type II toxin-antitoxin system VapC family toxin [Georgenia yuyongxinii]
MTAPAYLVDTSVFAYALGGEHPLRRPCQRLVEMATAGEVVLHASVELVQEVLHHRMRRGERAVALRQARACAELCVLHPFDTVVLQRALQIVESSRMRGRDAVHAATALTHGLPRIVSTDPDFDGVEGLSRLDPAGFVAG